MRFISTGAVIACIALAGCATPSLEQKFAAYQDQQEIKGSMGAAGKFPLDFISMARAHFGVKLMALTVPAVVTSPTTGRVGYAVCFVDEKDTQYGAVIRDGQIQASSKIQGTSQEEVRKMCEVYSAYQRKKYTTPDGWNERQIEEDFKELAKTFAKDPSKEHLFGTRPGNEQATIEWFKYNLKDYQSARIEKITEVQDVEYDKKSKSPIWGYTYLYQVNAKNTYGAYTGYRIHSFFVRNGKVLEHFSPK